MKQLKVPNNSPTWQGRFKEKAWGNTHTKVAIVAFVSFEETGVVKDLQLLFLFHCDFSEGKQVQDSCSTRYFPIVSWIVAIVAMETNEALSANSSLISYSMTDLMTEASSPFFMISSRTIKESKPSCRYPPSMVWTSFIHFSSSIFVNFSLEIPAIGVPYHIFKC